LGQDSATLSMSTEAFARATAGLTRLHLEQLCRQAKTKGSLLTFEEVKRRKREILRHDRARGCQGILP
jgi:hypothetical protein